MNTHQSLGHFLGSGTPQIALKKIWLWNRIHVPVKYGHFCCSLKKKKFTKFNHSNFQVFTLLKVFAEPVVAPQPTLCSVITHLSGWYGDVVTVKPLLNWRHLPWKIAVVAAPTTTKANSFHPTLLACFCHVVLCQAFTVCYWHLTLKKYGSLHYLFMSLSLCSSSLCNSQHFAFGTYISCGNRT